MSIERSRTFLTPGQLENKVVVVVGCGSVGAQAAINLVRMGVRNFILIDNGKVEEVNVGPQPFPQDNVGVWKVNGLEYLLSQYTNGGRGGEGVYTITKAMDAGNNNAYLELPLDAPLLLDYFIVLAVDSIEARRAAMACLNKVGVTGPIVDTRMGLQELWMTINVGKEEQCGYAATLPDDKDTVQEPCTERTIAYTPSISAGWLGRVFAGWCRGEQLPRSIHSNIREYNSWTCWRSGEVRYGQQFGADRDAGLSTPPDRSVQSDVREVQDGLQQPATGGNQAAAAVAV